MPTTWHGNDSSPRLHNNSHNLHVDALKPGPLTQGNPRRAAWHGARICMRQVSPESIPIFDFILELHMHCSGDWDTLVDSHVSKESLHKFLTYAATFLSNVGNYYVCCLKLS